MRSVTLLDGWVERGQRRGVDLAAMAYRSDGSGLPVKLRNISYEGCLLESEAAMAVGERITLALPRMGEIKAQVRWIAEAGKAGAKFVVDEVIAVRPCSTAGL